jgi:GNAT superfamily N-acetyltransferase
MIRTAVAGDLKNITDLAREYWMASPYGEHYGFDWDTTLNFIRTAVIRPEAEVAVFTHEGAIRGFAIALLAPLCFSQGVKASIEFVYIQSPLSRQDNYIAILDYMADWAQRWHAQELMIGDYTPINTMANMLYEEQGFHYLGQVLTRRLHND